jgi:hypothetical protein
MTETILKKKHKEEGFKLEMMPHACNPSTRDAEAGGSRPT